MLQQSLFYILHSGDVVLGFLKNELTFILLWYFLFLGG